MKKTALIVVIALAIVGTGYGLAKAHDGYGWGHMGPGYGHMGPGYGHMQGMMGYYGGPESDEGYCGSAAATGKLDLSEKDAEEIITYRVTRSNPNLKIGKVKSTEDGFEVQVVTKKGEALVDRLLVEKDTGRIYRVYE